MKQQALGHYIPLLEELYIKIRKVNPSTNNEAYRFYYKYESDIQKVLRLLNINKDNLSETSEVLSFKVNPEIEPEKIHFLSLLIQWEIKEQKFLLRKMKKIIPELEELNKSLEPLVIFNLYGGTWIEVERVWQKVPHSTHWCTG